MDREIVINDPFDKLNNSQRMHYEAKRLGFSKKKAYEGNRASAVQYSKKNLRALTREEVLRIREFKDSGLSDAKVIAALDLKVSVGVVYRLRKGLNYKDVT